MAILSIRFPLVDEWIFFDLVCSNHAGKMITRRLFPLSKGVLEPSPENIVKAAGAFDGTN
jgi:hypothetical protein